MKKLRLTYQPVIVTLAFLVLRFVLEAGQVPGRSLVNVAFLVPVIAVYLSRKCLSAGMGFGGFLSTILLYTVIARLMVIPLSAIGEWSGLGGSYFVIRNVFFLIMPQLTIWPLVSFVAGSLIWPVTAAFTVGRQAGYRGVAISGTAILALIFIGLPFAISLLYTSGVGRRSFEVTPESLGVPYEDITLVAADGTKLEGWYLDNPDSAETVVFCHGLFNQRSEMLEQAVFMHEKGYNALLFDFRHHGKSEGSYTTFGYFERQDVDAAIRYAREIRGEEGNVILWGISMGAANALLASAEQRDIGAVIAESSFYSVRETLRSDLSRMFRLSVTPFAWLVESITELRLGISLADLHVGEAARKIVDCPVFLVGGTADVRMPLRNNERLLNDIPGTAKETWVVEGAGHADIWKSVKEEYKHRVIRFLNRHLQAIPGPTEGPPDLR